MEKALSDLAIAVAGTRDVMAVLIGRFGGCGAPIQLFRVRRKCRH